MLLKGKTKGKKKRTPKLEQRDNRLSISSSKKKRSVYSPDPKTFKTFSERKLYGLRSRFEVAAMEVAKDIVQTADKTAPEKMRAVTIDLDARLKTTQDLSTDSDELLITPGQNKEGKKRKNVIFTKDYPDELARKISKSSGGLSSYPKIREDIKNRYIRGLNAKGWKTIEKEITFESTGKTYTSTIIPVNQAFHETFEDYGETGNSSMSPRLTDDPEKKDEMRATNLWLTQYKTGAATDTTGTLIFEAFRSGSLAYSLNDGDEKKRKEIADSKTLELLTAMAAHAFQAKDQKGKDSILKREVELDIPVISISLQTPTSIGLLGPEEQQVRDQIKALKEYENGAKPIDIVWNGKRITINAKFNTIAFDFGVNSSANLSVGPLGAAGVEADFNKPAIKQLTQAWKDFDVKLGKDITELENQRDQIKQSTPDQDRIIILKSLADAKRKRSLAKKLMDQILQAWKSGGSAYEIPARIANLAFVMGHLPHFNCKSGKDRTGLMDAESKFLAQQIFEASEHYEDSKVPEYVNELEGDQLDIYRQILMESGNLEVQETNTGVGGYKVVPIPALEKDLAVRIGKEFLPLVQGFKEFTDVEQHYKAPISDRFKQRVLAPFSSDKKSKQERGISKQGTGPQSPRELLHESSLETDSLRDSDGDQGKKRFEDFVLAMKQIPQAADTSESDKKAEPLDLTNQYVEAIQTQKNKQKFDGNQFSLLENDGGGDCLFHALEGKNLSADDLLVIRKKVADIKLTMASTPELNANNIVAALSQTPGLRASFIHRITFGRHNVPNNVYAQLQAVPGIYAGEDELEQWCILKKKKVAVVDADGTLTVFNEDGSRERKEYTDQNKDEVLKQTLKDADLGLFKTPSHWRRINT